jgi:hypothetical protein
LYVSADTGLVHPSWSAKDDQEKLGQLGLFLMWRARHAATRVGHQLQHTAESTRDGARDKLPSIAFG